MILYYIFQILPILSVWFSDIKYSHMVQKPLSFIHLRTLYLEKLKCYTQETRNPSPPSLSPHSVPHDNILLSVSTNFTTPGTHISGIIKSFSFCYWLISLNILKIHVRCSIGQALLPF